LALVKAALCVASSFVVAVCIVDILEPVIVYTDDGIGACGLRALMINCM
jgi:hypothetical protein